MENAIRREKAEKELRSRFGASFDDILEKTGLDFNRLIKTTSTNLLVRLANEKEFLISGEILLPDNQADKQERHIYSVRFVSKGTGVGEWNWSFYEVSKDKSRARLQEGQPLKIGSHFFSAESEIAERWRLCGTGFLISGTQSPNNVNKDTAILYTPAKWSDFYAVGRSVKRITRRLERLAGNEERTQLEFRALSEKDGFGKTRLTGFSFELDPIKYHKQIETLALGGQVRLFNNNGETTCVRYDCSENCLTESLPLDLARRLNERRKREVELKQKQDKGLLLFAPVQEMPQQVKPTRGK